MSTHNRGWQGNGHQLLAAGGKGVRALPLRSGLIGGVTVIVKLSADRTNCTGGVEGSERDAHMHTHEDTDEEGASRQRTRREGEGEG